MGANWSPRRWDLGGCTPLSARGGWWMPGSSLLTTHDGSHPGETEAAKVTGRIRTSSPSPAWHPGTCSIWEQPAAWAGHTHPRESRDKDLELVARTQLGGRRR